MKENRKENPHKHKSLIGNKYDKLTVMSLENREYNKKDRKYIYYYKCKCDCGNYITITNKSLTKNKKHSCVMCRYKYDKIIEQDKPDLVKYIKDKKFIKYPLESHKKITFICDICNKENIREIRKVTKYGYNCPYCSDNISYPEKVMRSFLDINNIKYEVEKIFDWSENRRYDFYIPLFNCIIETHGEQHYKENSDFNRSLAENIEIDNHKEYIAYKNGINDYIIIDCRDTNFEYIKKSIENSMLKNILNISETNWGECEINSLKSIVLEVGKEWNNIKIKDTNTLKLISNKLNISIATVQRYLKICGELGICNYTTKSLIKDDNFISYGSVGVRCIELNKEFNSITKCVEYLNSLNEKTYDASSIVKVCRGKISHHKGYHFEYINK